MLSLCDETIAGKGGGKGMKVEFKDMEIQHINSDAGDISISWLCPNCKQELIWAESMWWGLKCRCDYWNLEIFATAETEDEKNELDS